MVVAKPRKKKVTRKNPGIAPKKRRTKSEIRRSQAAKKGWTTRRAKAGIKASPKKSRKKPVGKKPTYHELEQKLERAEKTVGWVYAAENEDLHRDGTLAAWPSRARHLGKMTTQILKDMKGASKVGEIELADVVRYYSINLDIPAQELYTLLRSP